MKGFFGGFVAAGFLLIAASWNRTAQIDGATLAGPEAPTSALATTPVTAPSKPQTLSGHCQRRLDALLQDYPIAFVRRGIELRPESRPAVYGIPEIAADCPRAGLEIVLRNGAGSGGALTTERALQLKRVFEQTGLAPQIVYIDDGLSAAETDGRTPPVGLRFSKD